MFYIFWSPHSIFNHEPFVTKCESIKNKILLTGVASNTDSNSSTESVEILTETMKTKVALTSENLPSMVELLQLL